MADDKPVTAARHRGRSKTLHLVINLLATGGIAAFTWPIGRHRAN